MHKGEKEGKKVSEKEMKEEMKEGEHGTGKKVREGNMAGRQKA